MLVAHRLHYQCQKKVALSKSGNAGQDIDTGVLRLINTSGSSLNFFLILAI